MWRMLEQHSCCDLVSLWRAQKQRQLFKHMLSVHCKVRRPAYLELEEARHLLVKHAAARPLHRHPAAASPAALGCHHPERFRLKAYNALMLLHSKVERGRLTGTIRNDGLEARERNPHLQQCDIPRAQIDASLSNRVCATLVDMGRAISRVVYNVPIACIVACACSTRVRRPRATGKVLWHTCNCNAWAQPPTAP
jgi:hypothetical protein